MKAKAKAEQSKDETIEILSECILSKKNIFRGRRCRRERVRTEKKREGKNEY